MRSEVELASATHGIGEDASVDVGNRLRALREQRRMSIRALAEASGLAVNTLSLIENGRTSPSVSTLQRLAMTLQVPISAFFTPDVPQQRVVFTPAGQATATLFPHGALTDLAPGLANRTLEPLLLTLDPGAGSGPESIVHTGQEFVFGLSGNILYTVADHTYTIGPGDSLLFEAVLPHRWHNPGHSPAQALLVLCPLELPRSALERHGRV